jgi:hypothetical protein
MKAMTCKELGGKCDQRLSAGPWNEMVKVMACCPYPDSSVWTQTASLPEAGSQDGVHGPS